MLGLKSLIDVPADRQGVGPRAGSVSTETVMGGWCLLLRISCFCLSHVCVCDRCFKGISEDVHLNLHTLLFVI